MPRWARHMIRMVAAGLMVLAVLMLAVAQVPFESSGHADHAPAGQHHHMAAADNVTVSTSGAPCPDHQDRSGNHGHATACCVASCTLASAALPAGVPWFSRQADSVVVYHPAALSRPIGATPGPAARPPERIG